MQNKSDPNYVIIIYLDSTVYIGVAKGEPEIPAAYWPRLYDGVVLGQVIIVASGVALDEVQEKKTPGGLAMIDKILRNKDWVVPIETNQIIRDGAEELRNRAEYYNSINKSTKLKYNDSIHLYVAIQCGAHEMHTTDRQLLGLHADVLRTPTLRISTPAESDFYKSFLI